MKRLHIFGTSGFAREVRDIAHVLGWECTFIAADATRLEALSTDGEVKLESELGVGAGAFVIGVGDYNVRAKIAARHAGRLNFINLIHPSASFGTGQRERIESQVGVIVCAGVRFTNNIDVGDFTIFNLNCTVGHDSIVENFANIAPGANISGYVHVEEGCWIGTNAAINQGQESRRLLIGARTIIGSGSVVVNDCESDSTYVGVPAKKR